MRVAAGGLDLEDALAQLEDRDVEGAATEVEDRDRAVLVLRGAERQRGRRGLVDDAADVESGDHAGVLGRLALRVVEVRGHRDDGFLDLGAEVVLGRLAEVLDDDRGDLRRRVGLAPDLYLHGIIGAAHDLVGDLLLLGRDLGVPASHEALDAVDRVRGVRDGLPAGGLSHQTVAALGEGDYAGCEAMPVRVHDDPRLSAFHDGDHAVRGAEIDANDSSSHLVRYLHFVGVAVA